MIDKKTWFNIPNENIYFLFLCVLGVAVFIFVGIIPRYGSLANMDKYLHKLNYMGEEYKAFKPTYDFFSKTAQIKNVRNLPLIKKEKLSRENLDSVFKIFKGIGQTSNLELLNVFPDINWLVKNPGNLPVNVTFRGDFLNFRQALINISSIPYIKHIEEIWIDTTKNGKELKVKIWLAMEE